MPNLYAVNLDNLPLGELKRTVIGDWAKQAALAYKTWQLKQNPKKRFSRTALQRYSFRLQAILDKKCKGNVKYMQAILNFALTSPKYKTEALRGPHRLPNYWKSIVFDYERSTTESTRRKEDRQSQKRSEPVAPERHSSVLEPTSVKDNSVGNTSVGAPPAAVLNKSQKAGEGCNPSLSASLGNATGPHTIPIKAQLRASEQEQRRADRKAKKQADADAAFMAAKQIYEREVREAKQKAAVEGAKIPTIAEMKATIPTLAEMKATFARYTDKGGCSTEEYELLKKQIEFLES